MLDDPTVDEVLGAWQAQVLNQADKGIIEAIQARLPYAAESRLKPAMLACDEAAVRVARAIERLEALSAV